MGWIEHEDLFKYHTIKVNTNSNMTINDNKNLRLVAQSMPPRPHRHGVVHVLPLKPSMHAEHRLLPVHEPGTQLAPQVSVRDETQ
jgi:hypothetical protein